MPETSIIAPNPTMTPSMTTLLGLLSSDHGVTAADLAEQGSLGRSTATKTLAALESHGLARRESADRTGQRPTPDLWFAVAHHTPDQPQDEATRPESSDTADTTKPENSTDADLGPESETSAVQDSEPHDTETGETAVSEPGSSETKATAISDGPGPDAAEAAVIGPATECKGADTPEPAPGDADPAEVASDVAEPANDDIPGATAPLAAQAEATAPPRLAKGGLRALVVDYLIAHPTEEMTASAIGTALGRSSGAVANALDTLVKNGEAELTCEKPRKFRRLAPQTGN